MKVYEEGIIGGKTAPTWNGTGVNNYVDALLESSKPSANYNASVSQIRRPIANSTNGYGGIPEGMTTGTRNGQLSAKPTTTDGNSPIAYEKAKAMQQRLSQQNANATEAQKARPVIKALLDMIYGGNK